MKRTARFDPGWLAFVFATITLIIVMVDRWTVKENTNTHDALRTDEQGTRDAILKLGKSIDHLAEVKERESNAADPGTKPAKDATRLGR